MFTVVVPALSPGAAFAQTATKFSCGDTITKSTTLTSHVGACSSGNGIIIGADNIILDCRGHSITSNSDGSGEGILIEGHSGVTITNCKASGFENGFKLASSSSDNTLKTNTASNNRNQGFSLWSSSSNTLTGNRADTDSLYGYHDITQGTGTKGTGNTYRLDECHDNTLGGSIPPGLCLPQR